MYSAIFIKYNCKLIGCIAHCVYDIVEMKVQQIIFQTWLMFLMGENVFHITEETRDTHDDSFVVNCCTSDGKVDIMAMQQS